MQQTATMEREVPVNLRDEELLARSKSLAQKVGVRESLVEAKKAENKRRQEEIDEMDEEIAQLARVIVVGFEDRKQGDLFVDQALPKDEAARRLAEVAKRAERHPFVASETAIDTCAREGCGAAAAGEVHIPPAPSEPHTFVPDGKGEGNCWACGSGKDDPVHAEASAGMESANTPANETGENADTPTTVDCSRCSKNVPKTEVVYDRDVKPICETCKRAAIEAGTWPHPFRKGHEKARRCADCNGKPDDDVHEIPPVEPTPEEEQAVAEKAAATGDPAYDYPDDEPAPAVIRTHAAIERQ
jgi:hypothetical protein